MVNFPRKCPHGPAYSFTARLIDRRSTALVDHVALFRDCVAVTRKRWPFEIRAAVVLPASVNMVWNLPEGDDAFQKRWSQIKSAFWRHLPRAEGDRGAIWERSVWAMPIDSPADLTLHELHCLTAPVRAGLVRHPEDWPWSSLRRANASRPASGPVQRGGYLRLVG